MGETGFWGYPDSLVDLLPNSEPAPILGQVQTRVTLGGVKPSVTWPEHLALKPFVAGTARPYMTKSVTLGWKKGESSYSLTGCVQTRGGRRSFPTAILRTAAHTLQPLWGSD